MPHSIEVSPDELEEMADRSGRPLILPAGRAGWARLTVKGQQYHAWLNAPGQVSA